MLCPAATRRTASTRSDERICFNTYPAAPAMMARNSASSLSNDVRIRHAVRGCRDRISAARLDAVAVLELDVEHSDIRVQRVDPTNGLLLGGRPADHVHVLFGIQQICDAPADDLMIVEQEHRDHIAHAAILPICDEDQSIEPISLRFPGDALLNRDEVPGGVGRSSAYRHTTVPPSTASPVLRNPSFSSTRFDAFGSARVWAMTVVTSSSANASATMARAAALARPRPQRLSAIS